MKKVLNYVISFAIIVIVNIIFFSPQLNDKRVDSGDSIFALAYSKYIKEYQDETGKRVYWNPAMFSGMPWNLLTNGIEKNAMHYVNKALYLFTSYPMGYFFKASLMCFLALSLIGIRPFLATSFSLFYAININHIVLLEAGHANKIDVLFAFPLILSGVLIVFRKKYLLGLALMSSGISLAILRNHPQMLYYFGLGLAVFILLYSILDFIKTKNVKHYGIVCGLFVAALTLGLGSNITQIISSKSYSDDTMRGNPILSKGTSNDLSSSSQVDGLEWNYAMRWSHSLNELTTLLIPRFVGGSSHEEIDGKSETAQLLKQNGARKKKDGTYSAPMYWGGMSFTSGPNYFGIAVFFFFILSLFVLERKVVLPIVAAILLVLMISLGENAESFNRFLFENLPLLNKFRAPSSIINVLPVFMIFPAALGIQTILDSSDKNRFLKPLFYSLLITGLPCLLFWLIGGSLFSFTGPGDANYQDQILEIFINTRIELLKSDSLRSLALIVVFSGLIWAYLTEKLKNVRLFVGLFGLIGLADLWIVGKRYLDSDAWVSNRQFEQKIAERPVDKFIKQKEPNGRGYYRVLDLSVNTFNSSFAAAQHNSIGGYHGAKLQRYQDMIDYHISKSNLNVLNMLNGKYIISQNGQAQVNSGVLGNAWFINKFQFVDTPNQEIEFLSDSSFNAKNIAVVLKNEFASNFESGVAGDGSGEITLAEYKPDNLLYQSSSATDQFAVFSEVWYGPNKGWLATIDGNPVDIIRVNYVLRGLFIPKGSHTVEFIYKPESKGKLLTSISSFIIISIIFSALFMAFKNYKTECN